MPGGTTHTPSATAARSTVGGSSGTSTMRRTSAIRLTPRLVAKTPPGACAEVTERALAGGMMTRMPEFQGIVGVPVKPRMSRIGTDPKSRRSAKLEGQTTDISAPESMRKLLRGSEWCATTVASYGVRPAPTSTRSTYGLLGHPCGAHDPQVRPGRGTTDHHFPPRMAKGSEGENVGVGVDHHSRRPPWP